MPISTLCYTAWSMSAAAAVLGKHNIHTFNNLCITVIDTCGAAACSATVLQLHNRLRQFQAPSIDTGSQDRQTVINKL